MPRLNREESQARTRQRLIEAARSEIVKKGFALASVRDIADAAEIASGFIALGRGMALMAGDGEARRSGQMIVTFLKALIASAPPGAPPATKAAAKTRSK